MLEAFQKYLQELVGSSRLSVVSSQLEKKFLLAVSGGLDSTVMTELFRMAELKYSIAHCNFQLRGKESDNDEKFVKKLATDYKVPFFSSCFETEKFCRENKVSVQMGARQLRYNWLEEIRRKNDLNYIVTAHHADDAIETFFINLLRGSGISGLQGIKAKQRNVIRPLLHFYRKDIEEFAVQHKLKWREDSSNQTDKYKRNKIRHHLLPVLEEINPLAKESICTTIENLAKAELILNDSVGKITHKFIQTEGERTVIEFHFFKELIPAADYLYQVVKMFGFNYEQCKQVVECVNGQSGKIFLSDTHCISIDRKNLIIEPKKLYTKSSSYTVEKELEELNTPSHTYLFKITRNAEGFKVPKDAEKAALDFDKIQFPMKIRKWEKGDKFYPLGMNKPKKVSDFLVDSKVSVSDKANVNVLVSGKDIAWLIGYRPDERFKVTNATKNVYLCMLKK